MRPVVIKLGGSHARSALLCPWLRVIEAAAGRVVLVPGGGPFADVVRTAQPTMGYDAAAADAMAMLAMAQFGLALCSLATRLVPAESVDDIDAARAAAAVPVWAPLAMIRKARALPASWDVTSDSLALWLAQHLDASALLLVKPEDRAGGIAGLSRGGVLDAAFPRLHAAHPCPVFLAGPGALPAALDTDRLPGIQLAA